MDRNTKDRMVVMAQIAEVAERFDDMVSYVKEYTKEPCEGETYLILTERERSLFSIAYKSVTSLQRNSLRLLLTASNHSVSVDGSPVADELGSLVEKIRKELSTACAEVIQICSEILKNPDLCAEERIFYLKMTGDYNRYYAEFLTGEERSETAKKAGDAYQEAADCATKANLSPASACVLGLVLNYSVFYYEIVGDVAKAREIAGKAYEDALISMQDSDDLNKDAHQILPLLKDNLALWQIENEPQE